MSARPNLFLVGAPKCGTTSMLKYLDAHPQLHVPRIGEPHYFADDLTLDPARREIDNDQAYLALFGDAPGARWIGDKSTLYLFSEVAAERIARFAPEARILVMLRHPVDMIYSLHAHNIRRGLERFTELGRALDAEAARRTDHNPPGGTAIPEAVFYRAVADYVPQLQRYYANFAPEQVKVVLFDDLCADPAGTYRDVLRWLDVDTAFEPEFNVYNRGKGVRHTALRRMLNRHPTVKRIVGLTLPDQARGLIGAAWQRLTDQRQRSLDPALRAQLTAEFARPIDELGRILDRDLSAWKHGEPVDVSASPPAP